MERQQEETYLGRVPSGHNCLLCGQLRPRQMLGGKPLAATRLLCTKGPGPGGQAAMIRATPPSGPPLSSTSEPTLDLSLAQRVTWGSCQQPHQPPPWAFLHLPSKAHPDQPTPPRGPTPERRADLSRVCRPSRAVGDLSLFLEPRALSNKHWGAPGVSPQGRSHDVPLRTCNGCLRGPSPPLLPWHCAPHSQLLGPLPSSERAL